MEFLPRVGLRILTSVEDMGGILVFYWFFIILDASTYASSNKKQKRKGLAHAISVSQKRIYAQSGADRVKSIH